MSTNILENKLSTAIDQREVKVPSVWVPRLEQANTEDDKQLLINSTFERNDYPVLTSGKDKRLTQRIVAMLDAAQYTAILCSFLLADDAVEDAIFDAAKRGVRVYLMLACETRLDDDNPDDDFGKMCLNQHKAMLKRLAGKVMIRSAPYYHAKVVLVDAIGPEHSQAKGLLLTANLTSEALERNEELAVFLSRSEIEEMVDTFKWALFESAKHQMLDNQDFTSVKPLGEVEHPSCFDHILTTTRESNSIKTHALKLINSATSELIISSFGWQEDHEITDAICKKAKEGINVVILTRIRPRSMKALTKFRSAGASVFGFKWLHAKAIWNDSNDAMVMSANLQHRGLDTGFEVGVKLNASRAENLKICLLRFLGRRCSELRLDTKLGNLSGLVKVWNEKQFVDVDVRASMTKNLDPIVATCASTLDEKASIPSINWIDLPAHKIEYQWRVKAPTLPKGAKELFWEEEQLIGEKTPGKKRAGKKGKQKGKYKTVKHPYSPKAYKAVNQGQVIAITHPNEIQAAINLRNKTFSGANIVMLATQDG